MFPRLIHFGDFFIPTYGVLVALAFLTALWMTGKLARKSGLKPDLVMNLGIYCALAGMLGAKLMMIAFDWQTYWNNPAQLFSLSTLQAMGVYQGGLLLALVTAAVYMRITELPPLITSDAFAPGLALGHALGRLGCLAAGCCWGKVCTQPWAITFHDPAAHELTGVPLEIALHPTQLYESLSELVIFAYLYRRFHQPHAPGLIIGLYLILYSSVRFAVEFVRNHEQALPFGLPLSLTQWISLGTLALGIWLTTHRQSLAPLPSRS